MPYNELQLARILKEVRRPYLGAQGRDKLWDRRRDILHRRAKPWLPEGVEVENETVYYKDSLPGFVWKRVKSRLGANAVDVEIHMRGDTGPTMRRKGENLEDWLRGVIEELDPIGFHDGRVRGFQASDGIGVLKLETLPHFVPPQRNDEPDGDYDDLVEDARKQYGLPIALSSPDPRTLYWIESRSQVKLMCEVVNVPLVDVLNNWTAEGFRLAYNGDREGRLERMMIPMGEVPPGPFAQEYGRMVRLVIISDDENIYHCIYPQSASSTAGLTSGAFGVSDAPGVEHQLMLLAQYKNPIGRAPYFLAPASDTGDEDPAYRYEPLIMEILDQAEYVNDWRTMRMIKGRLEISKPTHAQPMIPTDGEGGNTAPKLLPGIWKPGFLEYPGKFAEIPTPTIEDFDKFDTQLTKDYNQYNLSIMGALNGGAIGKGAPAWTVMQFNEEQVGMLKEPLDSRAAMWRQVLLAITKLGRDEYGKEGSIYVRARKRNEKKPYADQEDMVLGLKAEDFSIPFRLEVNIEALTQSQRAADTEYWRELHVETTISDETYQENIGIQDLVQEQARKDRQELRAPLRAAAIKMGQQMAAQRLYQLHGEMAIPILLAVGLPLPPEVAQAQAAMQTMQTGQPPQGTGAPPAGSTQMMTDLHYPGHGIGQTPPQPVQPHNLGGAQNGVRGVA